jgi:hypothetical protein
MNEQERKEEIEYIEEQLNDDYIDMRSYCGDQNAFAILREALELYKEKYNIK